MMAHFIRSRPAGHLERDTHADRWRAIDGRGGWPSIAYYQRLLAWGLGEAILNGRRVRLG